MQRIIFQYRIFIPLLTLSTGLFISCTKEVSHDPETLVIALGSSPVSLDPRFATDANGMRITDLLFSSLVKMGPQLEVVGDAASSWSYDSKSKTYQFHLHPGLKFSNGREVLPSDILFSFAEYQKPNNPFHSALASISSVEARHDEKGMLVTIHLKEYSAKLLVSDLPVVKILPEAEVIKSGDQFSSHLVGSGSFQFERQTGNEIALRGRPDHPYAPPQIKKVLFKIIRDDYTRFQKTLKGSIDIAQGEIPLNKIKIFTEKKKDFRVFRFPGLSMTYLLINLQDPQLKQKSLRQAFSQSLQREELIQYKLEGFAQIATSILTPNNPFFNKTLVNLPHDLTQAKQTVEKLGLAGQSLTLKTSNNQMAVDNGRVLANQLSTLGVKINLQSFEWGTFYDDIQKGNFQLALMRWVGALDPDIYRIAFHSSEKPPGRNRGHYFNPQLDRLLEKGLKQENLKDRIGTYQEVQRIVHDDLPIIPLWYDEQVAIIHQRVNNYQPSLTGDFSPIVQVSKSRE